MRRYLWLVLVGADPMKRILLLMALLGGILILAACAEVPTPTPEPTFTPTPPAPRTLNVLVGAGRDTISISAFFPKTVRLRAGDTITWQNNTDDTHTTTFLSGEEPPDFNIFAPGAGANVVIGGPGELIPQVIVNPEVASPTRRSDEPVESYSGTGYFNSGIFTRPFGPGDTNIETYSLSFNTPGSYEYLCLIHPFMTGTLEVLPATATDVPSQEELDAQAGKEIAPMMAQVEGVITASQILRRERGPGDTTVWHVQVGARRGTFEVQLLQFAPEELTIKEGDTVVFTSATFHNVTFHPGKPPPSLEALDFPADGPPRLIVNPQVAFPFKSAGEFDGTGFFTSGLFGPGYLPGGTTFTMNFTKAGVYDYVCAIHRELGMTGTITVVPRN